MTIVPKRLSKRVEFYAARVAAFTEHATAIGTTPEEAAQLQADVDAAKAAYLAQLQALQAARTATSVFNSAVAKMNNQGATIISQVRTRARTHGDGVFALATLPVPKAKSPVAAPGTPSDLSTDVDAIGQLTLKWTCKNPRGARHTIYRIWRGTKAGGDFEYLGQTGRKAYVDTTIPQGMTALMYRIQAMRTKKTGEAVIFSVSFGSNRATPVTPMPRAA